MGRLLLFLPVLCIVLACGCDEEVIQAPAEPEAPVEEPQEAAAEQGTPEPEVEPEEQEEEKPVEPEEAEPAEESGEEGAEETEEETGETEEESGETEEKTGEEAGKEETEIGIMETKFGKIVIEFYPELAPKTVARIKELIRTGFYDGLIFHRIVPNFCVQGGDPTGTGGGGTGVKLPAEFTQTPYEDGSVGMARANDPDSGDCQFFITLSRAPNVAGLDNKYTLFGKVIEGLDVVHQIEKVELDGSRPKEDVQIISFRLDKRTAEEEEK